MFHEIFYEIGVGFMRFRLVVVSIGYWSVWCCFFLSGDMMLILEDVR